MRTEEEAAEKWEQYKKLLEENYARIRTMKKVKMIDRKD